jgi:Fe-S-cluster containining protein
MTKKLLCGKCTGLCCRYFALPIETPEDKEDYDDIRWYLCHENVSVFVEDGDWYINLDNKCRHLYEGDFKCGIYNKRPKICRAYSMKDCDLIEGEYDYELFFTDDQQMEEYIKIKFDNTVNKNKQEVKKRLKAGKKRK